jgi:hypothetical protein
MLEREPRAAALEIGGARFDVDTPGLAEAIASAYGAHRRPRCLCRAGGVEMYVARLGDGYIVKRMPETGSRHAPDCPSFEPPAEASGLGPLLGTAIREDPTTGLTTLSLDFSLSKGSRPTVAPRLDGETAVAACTTTKLSLRGLLHYLWDQAGLTRWQPGFAGKRSWSVVRSRLRQAAENHTASGRALLSCLYIPEPFSIEQREAIGARRAALWTAMTKAVGAHRPLILLIAELKDLTTARHGFRAVVKHIPDLSFILDERIFSQVKRRFETQLDLWGMSDDVRMLVIATFGVSASSVLVIDQLSLMTATKEWLPVESAFERQLVGRLVAEERCFTKCLRYNLGSRSLLPSATLTDCSAPPPLLFITPQDTPGVRAASDSAWQWRTGQECMPQLPKRRDNVPNEAWPRPISTG